MNRDTNTTHALEAPETPFIGIDREALKRLDAEIATKKRAEAERQATMTSATNTAPAALKKPDETSSAAAILEQQILETAPDLDRQLMRGLASLGAHMKTKPERQTTTKPAPQPKPTAQIIQLPLWPEQTRGTPNTFLRGALFAAIQGKERRALKGELLACQKGQSVRFTGWQLDQSDLDVWEQAAELARSHPLGNVCHFKITAFLRALGRNTGKSDREWLKNSFRRLMAAGVEITYDRYTYGGAMLEFFQDEDADAYVIRLNPTILNMYKAGWTAIDWATRKKLRRKPLALWLHGWLSSNAENYPVKVETLHSLSGSQTKDLKKFRQNLRAAIDQLKDAGIITAWNIDPDSDLVTIDRTPSPAQIRHRIKKAKPRKA
jgi:hypothetical protein